MPSNADSSNVFDSEMIINILFIVTIMVIDRYANRSDTKVINKGRLMDSENKWSYLRNKLNKKLNLAQGTNLTKELTFKTLTSDNTGGIDHPMFDKKSM